MPPEVEDNPMFVLLTDALRAGPGSPQWHDAVTRLREQGAQDTDEYKLLITARERLESGKEYRSVRPGPDFTRKVMENIENQPAPRRPFPTAIVIGILCAAAIIVVIGAVLWRTMSRTETGQEQQELQALNDNAKQFLTTVAQNDFHAPIADPWHKIGMLDLDLTGGLHPSGVAAANAAQLGGGVVYNNPLPADQQFSLEATIHIPQMGTEATVQLFVAADKNFSNDKAIDGRELVWQLRGNQEQVITNGNVQTGQLTAPVGGDETIRLIVGRDVAIVEAIGADKKSRDLWKGSNQLGTTARFAGIRFLQTGAAKEDLRVTDLRITSK